MADARPSGVLWLLGPITGLLSAVPRAIGWTLSSVEDEPPANVIPMPGPAHGPVPAIDLRLEERRKAS